MRKSKSIWGDNLFIFNVDIHVNKRDFKKALSKGFSLIAEIKKGSPSEGIINTDFDLEYIAKTYGKNKNVKAVSVLTDKKLFFMGSTS